MLFSAGNIPNVITLLRIVLVPVFIRFILKGNYTAALWIFFAAGVSDALDGFIAKRFNFCTRLGAFLDPLADKVLLISSVVVFARAGCLPTWLALTIIARDVVIVGGAGAFYLRSGRLDMAPSRASKLNTFVQICLIFALTLHLSGFAMVAVWLPTLFALTFAAAIVSGGHYVMVWGRKADIL